MASILLQCLAQGLPIQLKVVKIEAAKFCAEALVTRDILERAEALSLVPFLPQPVFSIAQYHQRSAMST
jgi:hypothetical protein